MRWTDVERSRCRRPIHAEEVAELEALGAEIRRLRTQGLRMSRRRFASLAELSEGHVARLEGGLRRTRASTLLRIAVQVVRRSPDLGDAETIASGLISSAGGALAPESAYRDRVERRHERRWDGRRRGDTRRAIHDLGRAWPRPERP